MNSEYYPHKMFNVIVYPTTKFQAKSVFPKDTALTLWHPVLHGTLIPSPSLTLPQGYMHVPQIEKHNESFSRGS
jgi:hypothetical protein